MRRTCGRASFAPVDARLTEKRAGCWSRRIKGEDERGSAEIDDLVLLGVLPRSGWSVFWRLWRFFWVFSAGGGEGCVAWLVSGFGYL